MKTGLQLAGLLLLPAMLLAHDTWLIPTKFQTSPGTAVRVKLATSEAFPTSDSAVSPDRIARFTVRTRSVTRRVEGYHVDETFLVADVTPQEEGHAIVVAETKPRAFVLEPEIFNDYLRDEELKTIMDARKARGESDLPGRERYRKIAKAILCVGDTRDKNYKKPEGLWLEIVPQQSPCRLRVGDTLTVLVLFEGKPIEHVSLAAGYEGGATGHHYPIWGKTDKKGRLRIPFDRPGVWFIRTLHMVRAKDDPEADWQSAFSTLTFEVQP